MKIILQKTNIKNIFLQCKKIFLLIIFSAILSNLSANVYTVNTLTDSHVTNAATGQDAGGNISFRSALEGANALGGTHTINVIAGTHTLTLGAIVLNDIAENITINGTGNCIVSMSAASPDRILLIGTSGLQPNMITIINGITFTGGKLSGDNFGGGAIIAGGPSNSLTLNGCTFTNNTILAAAGGGNGGAVRYNGGGTLTITNCTFTGNTNVSNGGAVSYFLENLVGAGNGALSITGCTFNNNSVSNANGGALDIAAQGLITPGTTFTVSVLRNSFTLNSTTGTTTGGGAIVIDNAFAVGNTANINFNRFVSNSAAVGPNGLAQVSAQGNVNADNNWWGCNTGPSAAGTCDKAVIIGSGGAGTLTATKWLQLKASAATSPICATSGTSVVTASFLSNSANESITTTNLSALIGKAISFSQTLGGLSSAQTTIQSNGTATVTYTGGSAAGTGTVNAVVDNVPTNDATAKASITINKVSVTNPAITTGATGVSYSQNAGATGGVASYSYATTSTLPTGITLSTAGVLSGTPTQAGTFPIVINATDANSCVGSGTSFNLVITGPAVTVTGTPLSAFSTCSGTASAEQSFVASGSNLTTNISISAPTGFEISTTSGSGFASSLTLTQSGGTVANTTIYVRLTSAATGSPSGNIVVASTGATTVNVTVSGTVATPPTTANAGSNQNICGALTTTLAGNTPTIGTGTWTQTAGPGITAFSNANSATSTVTASVQGAYTYRWTIASAGCASSSSDVNITFGSAPTTANAGPDLNACLNPGTATMAANVPTSGIGTWSQTPGGPATAIIVTTGSATSNISNLTTPGTYTFVWSISNPGCPTSTDTMTITVYANPTPFIISGGGVYCPSQATLTGPSDPNYTYAWERSLSGITSPNSFTVYGGTAQTQVVTSSGNYRLIVTNQFGCSTTDTASVAIADYVFNGTLGAGDAQQTGRMNRFGVVSTCASPKAYPGNFTTTGARYYDSYTITNPRSVPVCATIGIASACGVNMFSAAYTGSFNPTSLGTNYLADPGSSFPNVGFYEATIPANGTIVVVVHEVNVGTGCTGYQLTVDMPRDLTAITATPSSVSFNATSSLAAPVANTYLWSPGGGTTQNITTAPITANGTKYYATLGYGNVGCNRLDSVTVNLNCSPATITCPANITQSNTTGICGKTVTYTTTVGGTPAPTLSYSFSGATTGTGSGNGSGSTFNVGTTTVTVTAINACGNVNCSFTVTINDTEAPSITTGTINSCYTTVALAEAAAIAATIATDNCSGTITKTASTVGTCSAVITVTVKDIANNTSTTTYNTRIDNTAPTVTVGTINSCYTTVAAAEAAALAATNATDNCPGALTKVASTVGTCSAVITVTTTDGCGNATAVTYNTRIDNTAPTITCPIAITVCGNANIPAVNISSVSATDNCPGAITITHQGDVSTPSTTAPYVITRTYRATDGCGNFVECTQLITVNPIATVNTIANQTVCNGSAVAAVNFGTTATGGTVVYNWTNNTTSIGLAASGTGNIATFNGINSGTVPVTATITVTPTFTNGAVSCVGTASTFTITVNPTATVNTVANQVVCNGSPVTAVNFGTTVSGGTVVYNWTNNTTSIGLAASGTGNIATFNGINTGTTPVTATITVTPTFTNGAASCVGTASTFTITVNPAATVNTVANQVVCNGSPVTAVNFGTTATGGTVVYNWTNNTTSIGLAASGTGNIATFNGINTGTSPVTATITVTPTFTNGAVSCVGTASTFTITVNPTAVVNTVANQVVCNGSPVATVNFGTSVTGGTTIYAWTNNTTSIGLGASGTGNIATFNGINTGTAPVTATITVTPTFTNGGVSCVGTARTFTITVNPTATVNAITNQVVCNGSPVTAVLFGTTATGGTVVYNWTNNTSSIGLAASGIGDIATFNGVNTSNAPVTATVTVTPTFTNGGVSCVGTPRTFTITVNPTPTINTVTNIAFCNAVSSTVIPFSGFVPGTVYNWTNSNTAIGLPASGTGNIPVFTPTNAGTTPITATITVTPSFSNGGVTCTGASTSFVITVNPTTRITLQPISRSICFGTSTVFTVAATGLNLTYQWQVNYGTGFIDIAGATTASYNVIIPPNGGVNYNGSIYRCVVTGTCGFENSTTATLTIIPTPTISLTATQTVLKPFQTTSILSNASPAGGTYKWYYNNVLVTGANSSSFSPIGINNLGEYNVVYTDLNGCVASSLLLSITGATSENVWVYPNPSNGQFNVRFYNQNREQFTVSIYDDLGQRLYKANLTTGTTYSSATVNIGNLAAGIYILKIMNSAEKALAEKRIVIMH